MKAVDKFIQRILGISKPWFIEKTEDKLDSKEIHIYLNYKPKSKFKCISCGKRCTTFDSSWRIWRDLDIHTYKTYIHARIPRIKCCNKTTIIPPWARENSHFTQLMEDNILKIAKMTTITKESEYIKEHDTRLWRVIIYYVDKARNNADFSNITKIGMDETSKRGHRYITNFINLDTRKVIYCTEGKDHTTVDRFIEDFKAHGGIPEDVTDTTCDMSKAFKKGIKENFPNAIITIDKFHVIQLINDAIDDVRKIEVIDNPLLKKLNIYG